jgi:hypothetical protein
LLLALSQLGSCAPDCESRRTKRARQEQLPHESLPIFGV